MLTSLGEYIIESSQCKNPTQTSEVYKEKKPTFWLKRETREELLLRHRQTFTAAERPLKHTGNIKMKCVKCWNN